MINIYLEWWSKSRDLAIPTPAVLATSSQLLQQALQGNITSLAQYQVATKNFVGNQFTPRMSLHGARRQGHPPMTNALRLCVILLAPPMSEVRAHCFGMKSFTPFQQHSDQLTLSLKYGQTNCSIFQLLTRKIFLEEAISNYQNSKSVLSASLIEDMQGNIAMQLIHCWLLDAGQPIESMHSNMRIRSLTSSQCLSVIQIPGHNLLISKNGTGHHRLIDFPTFVQNVKINLDLSVVVEPTSIYKILIWTGSELRFTDVEADEMVIGHTNPSVCLAQEIYAKTIKKETKILQQLQALKEFAEPQSQ